MIRIHTKPFGTHFQLTCGFFSRHIQNSDRFRLEVWQICSIRVDFPIPGAPPTSTSEPFTAPPPSNPIQLPHACRETNLLLFIQFRNVICLYGFCRNRRFRLCSVNFLLHKAVPCPAYRALPCPFGTFAAALRTEICCCFFHMYHPIIDIADIRSILQQPASFDNRSSSVAGFLLDC